MPSRLSKGDLRLLWSAGALGAVLVAATAVLSPPEERESSPIPSSYSSDPDGTHAAYLLLSDLKFSVRRFEQAPVALRDAPVDAVLILAEPTQTTTGSDRKALNAFAERGGRILFCGESLQDFLPLPEARKVRAAQAEDYEAVLPSALTRHAEHITMRAKAQWGFSKGLPVRLYGKENEPVVVVSPIGKGELIWWAGATPMTNVGLTKTDNLRLFMNAVSNADGTPRPVYWDEYFHGQQGDLWSYIAKTPLPMGMWQLALVSVVLLFAYSRRSGPVMMPRTPSRLSPLEFVDTMGDLYERASARGVAIDVPYRRLRLQLARALGRSSETSDVELARLAAERLVMPEAELRTVLQDASQSAYGVTMTGKQALDLVQKLAGYSQQLSKPRLSLSRFSEEKKI